MTMSFVIVFPADLGAGPERKTERKTETKTGGTNGGDETGRDHQSRETVLSVENVTVSEETVTTVSVTEIETGIGKNVIETEIVTTLGTAPERPDLQRHLLSCM